MSSQPPEAETHEVTLSRDEQWVVHAILAGYIDDAIDADETPPAWAIELLEAVESGDNTEVLTGLQTRRLADVMGDYLEREDIPDQDRVHGSDVADRLEAHLESTGTA
ncbi:hypothetical protein Htur_0768 [Haloterrigena turkmenica DSM 5511]|uniref:Uncharacterized protein n=1 Tax=Haloterrigena turkmenica (strain ATCC 51198 / DSM 5511 / JCM 9101 / NCIMB 13204 / VKM B-1734 / 4k) TaxID=543526 RepID=D2RX52_HALTV|nr:hypothetical protein [Haloterrigena turkmenica]ADB59664.1 hypothetical protein Htur_0768 [Haloterrigena turkmenica DSM 5511]